MNKITFIAAAALPLLSLVSCGEKETPAAPVTTEAAAESPAAPVTAEAPFVAFAEAREQLATTFEATTPENSAEQAKKIKEIAAKMPELLAKLEEKGPDAKPSPDVAKRIEAAEARFDAWYEANVTNLGSYDPSFTEALEAIQMK